MGLFSRTKKNSDAPTSSAPTTKPIKIDSRTKIGLKNHPTGFYKNSPKNANGLPVASRMYWNVSSVHADPYLIGTFCTLLNLVHNLKRTKLFLIYKPLIMIFRLTQPYLVLNYNRPPCLMPTKTTLSVMTVIY